MSVLTLKRRAVIETPISQQPLPFTGTGKVVYDPYRAGMKSRVEWWAVIEIEKDITRYYRWWLHRRFHLQLDPPAWDAHISLIRGERPDGAKKHLWKKHHGRKVEFKYGPTPYKIPSADGRHFWVIDVECQAVQDIRTELGRPYKWPPHITIGRERV